MREINLLPPEEFLRKSGRRLRARLFLIGALYVVLLVLLTFLWQGRVTRAEDLVVVEQQRNETLQQRVNELSDAQLLVDDYDANARLIADALTLDMSWGRLLNDLARMIPDRVWLESFTGAVSEGGEESLGSVSVAGVGFSYPDVSAWLRSLDSDRFPGVDGTWVQTVSDAVIGRAEVVSFSSSTSLTASAFSNRVDERVPVVGQ